MPVRPNVRERWLNAIAIAAMVSIIAWILKPEFSGMWNAREARRELVAFTSSLAPGMSPSEARARFMASSPTWLTATDVDANLTLVHTPYTFGAGNWVAWIDFRQDRLISVRIRTADGERSKPDGSPPDVGVPPPPRH